MKLIEHLSNQPSYVLIGLGFQIVGVIAILIIGFLIIKDKTSWKLVK